MEENQYINNRSVYKTYTCSTCKYKADVSGEIQKNYNGTYKTHVCLNCRILVDCLVENAEIEEDENNYIEIKFTPNKPHCLVCDDSNLIEWDSDLCKCPKCEKKMTLTRLELDGFDTSKIKII